MVRTQGGENNQSQAFGQRPTSTVGRYWPAQEVPAAETSPQRSLTRFSISFWCSISSCAFLAMAPMRFVASNSPASASGVSCSGPDSRASQMLGANVPDGTGHGSASPSPSNSMHARNRNADAGSCHALRAQASHLPRVATAAEDETRNGLRPRTSFRKESSSSIWLLPMMLCPRDLSTDVVRAICRWYPAPHASMYLSGGEHVDDMMNFYFFLACRATKRQTEEHVTIKETKVHGELQSVSHPNAASQVSSSPGS